MNELIEFNASKSVGGITGWYWIKTDSGAWSGPKDDWEIAHLSNIQKFVPDARNKTVVQAGGNLGMYPKLLSKVFSKVYTFEPDPLNFACLTLNCTEDNIVKAQYALGKDNGHFCVMHRLTMQNVGMHKVIDDFDQTKAMIPLISLDTFSFKNVGLLMLDLEQYEFNAVKGAQKLIQENRPVIFIEHPSGPLDNLIRVEHNYHIGAQSKMDTVYIPN